MKKILFFLFFFLFIPITHAYKVTDYKIQMTILENGNIEVVEMFRLDGEYNGYERLIKYRNNYDGYKAESLISVDKHLYDGSGIVLNEIGSIKYSKKLTIEEIIEDGYIFEKVTDAQKGDYGVYEIEKFNDGEGYKIYNFYKQKKDFYLNYTLKNMVISHNDISELLFPLFYDMQDTISYFELEIKIPTNKEQLKIWIHGPEAKIQKIDNQTIKVNISNLNANEYFDFRLIFDKIDTNKLSEVDALDKIVQLEENLDIDFNDKTNKEYEELKEMAYDLVNKVGSTLNRNDYNNAYETVNKLNNKDELKIELLVKLMNIEPKIERKEDIFKVLLTSVLVFWLIGNIIIIYHIYKKYNKKKFKYKYYKDIPNDYNPTIVGYLIHKKITNDDLVASILYLINKNVIKIENKHNDYILKKNKVKKISQSEEWLLKLIFGEKKETSLINFEHKAKDYDDFLNIYSNWLNIATNEAETKEFFMDTFSIKLIGIIYSVIGFLISLLLIEKDTYFSSIYILIFSLLSFIYYIKFYKRTLSGNLEYSKWVGFKKYIEKLYTLNIEQLPKNVNEYIIYSISLNCDYSLSRVIKIDDYIYDLYDSIIYTINTAYLTKKATHLKYSSINKNKR